MKELLFFILGLVIGGLAGITVMCCLQINRLNGEYYEEEKYKKANMVRSNGSQRTQS